MFIRQNGSTLKRRAWRLGIMEEFVIACFYRKSYFFFDVSKFDYSFIVLLNHFSHFLCNIAHENKSRPSLK